MISIITKQLHQNWISSKWFRLALILATTWAVLRLTFQIVFAAGLFPELTGDAGVPYDLPVYMKAAHDFQSRQVLYPQDLNDSTYHYPYSPPFAMLSMILLLLPVSWVAVLGTLLTAAAYILLYFRWTAIFQRFSLGHVTEQMTWTLPIWLIYSAFWGLLFYLNIGVIVVLVATLLIETILEEQSGWSALWLTLLLISKFMWAFPIAIPLLLGRRQFFLRLIALSAAAYLVLVGMSIVAAGSPAYIVQQYGEYINHLKRLGNEFPWRVITATPFLGYNHSIKQILIFLLGNQKWVLYLTAGIKITLLVPLAVISWRLLRRQHQTPIREVDPIFLLDLVFVLYLGAFIWLDIVWEVMLGIVVFAYLLATLKHRREKSVVWIVFLPYAFVDLIQLLSYIIGGDRLVDVENQGVLTDPSLYLPLVMIVILAFYFLLIRRLWLATYGTMDWQLVFFPRSPNKRRNF